MAEKLYYSMGEVTEMFDVTPALIRYWCEQFSTLKPKRNAKGNRLFSPNDIEQLKLIYHLLKEKRMTIEGAKKALRKERVVSGMPRTFFSSSRATGRHPLLIYIFSGALNQSIFSLLSATVLMLSRCLTPTFSDTEFPPHEPHPSVREGASLKL